MAVLNKIYQAVSRDKSTPDDRFIYKIGAAIEYKFLRLRSVIAIVNLSQSVLFQRKPKAWVLIL